MNNIKKYGFYLILLAGVLSSCMNDDDTYGEKVEDKTMRFTFTMPESVVNTRSVAPEEGENKVNDLTLLFFEPTTNETGKFLGYFKVPASQLPAGNEMEFSLNVVFDNGLSKTKPYSILAMANMSDNYLPDMESSLDAFLVDIENMNQADVIQYATMKVQGVGTEKENDDSQAILRSNLPMSAKGNKGDGESLVAMKLVRAVSRFDVINNASGYVIESVSIWNAFTVNGVWEGAVLGSDYPRTKRFYGLKNSSEGFEQLYGGLYAFENISTSPEQNDDKTTCLIFGIRPSTGTPGTDVTYYRLNVNSKERGQYLKRNNAYQITISGVNGIGENTEYDAYTGGKFLLDVSINTWDRDEDGLIIRDGENMMALPTRKAVFSPKAEERQYYVYTLGTGTLEMEYLDMPTGMNAWLSGNNLFVSVTDYAFEQRKGSILLKFAGMSGIIEIVQSGKTERFLSLSHTHVATYPAGSVNGDMLSQDPILIKSSGPWTAKIYNGDYFSFNTTASSRTDTKTGVNGDYINNIYNIEVNPLQESRTAFVLISLDEDPDNYRNVVILTQAGTGGFTLSPTNTNVNFEPDKSLASTPGNNNEFRLVPGDQNDTWTATIEPGMYSDKFTVVYDEGNTVSGMLMKGTGQFSIVANEVNYTDTYTATVLVSLNNGAKTKVITVSQGYYGLTVSPQNTTVEATGGTAVISVTSPGTNLTWSAVVTGSSEAVSKDLIPYFSLDSNGNPVTHINGLAVNTTFNITMPGINTHLTEQPKATVLLTLDGTSVTKEVIVTQQAVTYIDLHAQTIAQTFGRWTNNEDYFKAWKMEMINANNFGPSGTIYAKAAIDCGHNRDNHASNSQVLFNSRIFNVNAIESASRIPWASLKENQYTTFVMSEHNGRQNVFSQTGFTGFNIVNTDRGPAPVRTITTNAGTLNTEIYKYLFNSPENGGGPWGPVNPANVSLHPGDGDNSTINAWPDTFIPLIYDPLNASQVVVGIDPSNKMVYIGDTELFGYFHSNYADVNSDNMKFMRNLISWMVHVNNYGKAFNDRFKNDKSR